MNARRLVVFEGPDGVGKSELAARFHIWLLGEGVSAELLSFPGKEPGSVGKLVYDLHAHPEEFGISQLSPASLQALHIAAHLDSIERRIAPSLESNRTVVLDRFWWSTYVYGIASGAQAEVLKRLISAEKAAWGAIKPTALFVVDRGEPLRPESLDFWRKCRELYRELLSVETTEYPCGTIGNEGNIEETFAVLIDHWQRVSR